MTIAACAHERAAVPRATSDSTIPSVAFAESSGRPEERITSDSLPDPPTVDRSRFIRDTALRINPAVGDIPLSDSHGAYLIPGACPGEYCAYGAWTLSATVILRRAPTSHADSVGSVPAGREICADSGFVLIDPPGKVVALKPPPVHNYSPYPPTFGRGDTLVILNELGEGYWVVRWKDSITVTEAYWTHISDWSDAPTSDDVAILRKPSSFWWSYITDRYTGARGWLLMRGFHFTGEEHVSPCS
jgi:hypothetical protein